MRVLLLLLLMGACANKQAAPIIEPRIQETVVEAPAKPPPPPPPKPKPVRAKEAPPLPPCPAPSDDPKKRILQELDCLIRLEKAKP